jgi:Protein of unknown function (DUF1416)
MSTKLTGAITVHGSKPARTAVVELHNSTGDVVDQVQVDGEGRYVYHLSAGEWTLRVWDKHGHRGLTNVSISDEDEKVADLELEEPEGGH